MTTNQDGINLIKQFEGLRLKAYKDTGQVETIGYGHTGPDVIDGLIIDSSQAEALLRDDLKKAEHAVDTLVKVNINLNEFSALVSFTYNLGIRQLKDSTLLKKLNNNDKIGAASEFGHWIKDNGKVLSGLVKRREAEKALFLKPIQ